MIAGKVATMTTEPARASREQLNPAIAKRDMDSLLRLSRCCEHLISTLPLPEPFDVSTFLANLARQRGRQIELIAAAVPFGMLVTTSDTDYIVYPNNTTRLHAQHIALHEVGHLLLNHPTSTVDRRAVAEALLPDLSPKLVRRILGRTTYSDNQEYEAESFASVLGHLTTRTSTSSLTAESYARCHRLLEPLWTMLTAEVSHVLLPSNTSDDPAEFALYRRVIEIRDAQRELQPFYPPEVTAQLAHAVQGLDPVHADLITEATELAAALAVVHRTGNGRSPNRNHIGIHLRHNTIADALDEGHWLVSVAHTMCATEWSSQW